MKVSAYFIVQLSQEFSKNAFRLFVFIPTWNLRFRKVNIGKSIWMFYSYDTPSGRTILFKKRNAKPHSKKETQNHIKKTAKPHIGDNFNCWEYLNFAQSVKGDRSRSCKNDRSQVKGPGHLQSISCVSSMWVKNCLTPP